MELIEYITILWGKRWVVLAAFLSTIITTSVFTYLQTPVYEATSTFIIAPTGISGDAESMVDVLDAMSRRAEIAGTYAKVASSRIIQQQVAEELGLSPSQWEGLTVASRVLPDTNVLEITVRGSDGQLVQLFADAAGVKVAAYAQDLYEAYGLRLLDQADLSVSPGRNDRLLTLALGAIVGLALGVGMGFVTHYLEPYVPSLTDRALPSTQAGSASDDLRMSDSSTRRAIRRWTGRVVLAVALGATGAIVWLSAQGTWASNLPRTRLSTPVMPTVIWPATADMANTPFPTMSPTPTLEPSATPCPYPMGWAAYEVQVEDTLSSLADRYDMSIAEIADANCLSRRVISAGQLLYFPPPETATPEPTITATATVTLTAELSPTVCIPPEGWTVLYTVQAGDSLYSLALSYDVTVGEIVAANCLESTFLSAGRQQLYLPPLPEGGTSPEGTAVEPSQGFPLSTPLPLGTGSASLPPPVLIAPDDRSAFSAADEIVLEWQPVIGLPTDAYYVITVAYSHQGETWYDEAPWTRDTTWALSEHGYLLNLSDDGRFTWWIQVVRLTGTGVGGSLEGEALSEPSDRRGLVWNLPSSGGGGAPTGTPPVPPP